MRWPFFSNWTKDTNSHSRILNKHWPPRRRIHSPLRSEIDSGIGFKLGGVHLIGGRVSSVRKTKRFGGGLCLRKGSWSKKIGRENVVLIIKEPPSQGYHHFRLRMRTLKLEIVPPHGVGELLGRQELRSENGWKKLHLSKAPGVVDQPIMKD